MKKFIISLGLLSFTISSAFADNSDQILYKAAIEPVMSGKCVSCHGEEKQKGKLRLDTVAAMLKGGSEGESLVPGDPEGSSILERIHLPLDDDEHMPPEKKTQLTKEEISVLEFWIKSGAKEDATIAALKAPADIVKAITAVIATSSEVAPTAPKSDLPTKLSEEDEKLIAATIEKVKEKGGNLMAIAQNTPQLRFSALNVSKTFGDEDLKLLEPVSDHILWLDLGRTQVTDGGLAVLGNMKNLTRLKLENTKVSDQALDHVKSLSKLEYLNLYGTGVTDQGIAKLSGNKNLKKLYLWQTKTTGGGVSELAKSIPGIYINTGAKTITAPPKKETPKPKTEAKAATKAPVKKEPAKNATPSPPKPANPKPNPPAAQNITPKENGFLQDALAELEVAVSDAKKDATSAQSAYAAAQKKADDASRQLQILKASVDQTSSFEKDIVAALEAVKKAINNRK